MEGAVPAASAEGVALGVLLTKASGTFSLWTDEALDDGCMRAGRKYHLR